jgi:hypothetical protein
MNMWTPNVVVGRTILNVEAHKTFEIKYSSDLKPLYGIIMVTKNTREIPLKTLQQRIKYVQPIVPFCQLFSLVQAQYVILKEQGLDQSASQTMKYLDFFNLDFLQYLGSKYRTFSITA